MIIKGQHEGSLLCLWEWFRILTEVGNMPTYTGDKPVSNSIHTHTRQVKLWRSSSGFLNSINTNVLTTGNGTSV